MVSGKMYEVIDHVVYYPIDSEGWQDDGFYHRREVTGN